MESDFENTLHRLSLVDSILNFSLGGWVLASAALLNRISFTSFIFVIVFAALILLFAKLRVKSIQKKLKEDMKQGMDKAVAPLHNKIPLTRNDFTLATKFGKSIAYLGHHEEIEKILDDEWQSDDPSDIETYVSESDAREAIQNLEDLLTSFTLINHDGESHHELSHIVYILQNPEKFTPYNDEWGVDELIDWITEAADISGWYELEKIINRIDLKQFRT